MTLSPRKESVLVIFPHCTHQISDESMLQGAGAYPCSQVKGIQLIMAGKVRQLPAMRKQREIKADAQVISSCVCVCSHVCVHAHMCVHARVCAYSCVCMLVCVHDHVCACPCVHTHVCAC